MENQTYIRKLEDARLTKEIVKMDNTLVKKTTLFNVDETKLFFIALASIQKDQKSNIIRISKTETKKILNYESDGFYSKIRKRFEEMMKKSFIRFGSDEERNDGFLFTNIKSDRNYIYLKVSEDYFDLLIHVVSNFTLLWLKDLVSFKSKYSVILYQNLIRLKNKDEDGVVFSTRGLKEIFDLDKDSYCSNGKFNRYEFDRNVVNVAVNEINVRANEIKNVRYDKLKKNRRVIGYIFYFDYKNKKTKEAIEKSEEQRRKERIIDLEDSDDYDI